MMKIADYVDLYLAAGLKIIPIAADSKAPINKAWNTAWDAEKVKECFKNDDNLNIGLLLGDVLDVEGDTPEANAMIKSMIANYPHPKYKSEKSVHHLFLNPFHNLTRIVFKKMEFRGHLHQSVLPPSRHPSGAKYYWLKGTQFPIPQLPDELYEFIHNRLGELPKQKKRPPMEAPWCAKCGKKFQIPRSRFEIEIEAFHSIGSKWVCYRCRYDKKTVPHSERQRIKAICKNIRQNKKYYGKGVY